MAKDPAFLFYPGDFTTGTQFFNDEQVGKYIRLLLAQHQHGHLPEEHMIHICKTYDKHIFSKFEKDSDGNYFNQRLETEITKRKNYTLSRSKNRNNPNKENIICDTYVTHMENKNENKDIIINSNTNNKNNEFFQILNTSEEWLNLTSSQSTNKFTVHQVKVRLKKFTDTQNAKFDYKANKKEFASHFVSWLNQQDNPEKPKKIS